MGDNRITGDVSTDPLAAKSRTVSADEVKIDYFEFNFIFFLKMIRWWYFACQNNVVPFD